jgi:cyclophilin family peptidyl-prolyl cis-trans isomerase
MQRFPLLPVFFVFFLVVTGGCESALENDSEVMKPADNQAATANTDAAAPKTATPKVATPVPAPSAATPKSAEAGETTMDERVVLTTKHGKIVIDLFEDDAPGHAANFKKLAREGFYNGLTFHRVIAGFMAQGGDPDGTGSGGPGYTQPAEIKRKHVRGSVAAARLGDRMNPKRDSSGSQFYICFQTTAHLDDQYTVFGQVVEGMDVVDKLKVGTGPTGDTMDTVEVVPAE